VIDPKDLESLADDLRSIADELRTLGSEQEDKIGNMPVTVNKSPVLRAVVG